MRLLQQERGSGLRSAAASSPRAAPRSSSLTAAAQATARPRECAPTTARSALNWGTNVWDAAREPNLDRYCDLLARGFSQLPFSPEAARDTADAADKASPGHASPWVLRGRAYAASKAWDKAAGAFEHARGLDVRSLDDPITMRDWARSLARTDRPREALTVYRTLAPRLSLLASADERARTFVEAAELAFTLGAPALDDAVAFLGEAKQLGVRDLDWRIGSELALAFDRRGTQDQATGLVSELAQRFGKASKSTLADAGAEELAASALVLEAIEPRLAIDLWTRYLAAVGERSPWTEHARQRLELLRRRGK